MRSVSKKTGVSKKAARDEAGEKPVSDGIRRAAKRAGIEPTHDSTPVTMMRGDLVLATQQIQLAFDDVFAAELSDDGAQHDVLVLRALRRLRNTRDLFAVEIGGAP